jgi:peptide/nickel transport system substrate-binding protein
MVVDDHAVIPVVYRPGVSGLASALRATMTGWDNAFSFLKDWYRET